MMNLAEYRNRNTRLADFLPWVALVGEGIVLNKDGSLQRTARFRGPDLDSAVPAELVAVAGRLNNAFRRLGSGWAIFVEAQRHGAATYPASVFADSASALVDAERKADFEEAGAHFESSYFLTFLYLPPAEDAARAETWLYEGRDHAGVDAHEILRGFADRTDRILQLIDAFMPECAWLDDGETLTYLHSTVSTKRHRVRVPETPIYLDALLAADEFPFPLAGLVHVSNTMTLHRPVGVGERLRITVQAEGLAPHAKGATFDMVSRIKVGDETVWEGSSNYLATGAKVPGEARAGLRLEATAATPSQLWRLPADLGRRYAAVSGDANPIHLHPATARLFGFPRPIIHGMWTHARALAGLGRLPDAYRARVQFAKPILLPGKVSFAAERAGDGWSFAVVNAAGKPHLIGEVRPAGS